MPMANIAGFLWRKIASYFQRSSTKRLVGGLIFFTFAILVFYSKSTPSQLNMRADEVATRTIQSTVTAVVIDEKQTDEAKRLAGQRVQKVYQENKYAPTNTRNDINSFYTNINTILTATDDSERKSKLASLLETSNKSEKVKLQYSFLELAQYALDRPAGDFEQIRKASLDVAEAIMSNPIKEDTMDSAYTQAEQEIEKYAYAPAARDIIKIAVINNLRPTLLYDREATEKAVTEAMNTVQPVQKTIKVGEVIVREGERVTQEQISVLEQLGLQRNKNYPLTVAGYGVFTILAFWLLIEYLRRYNREIYNDDRLLIMIGIIFILILVLARLSNIIRISDQPDINVLRGFLAPVAAGSMLVAILLDNRLAYFFTMLMAVFTGLLNDGNHLAYTVVAFAGGIVGIFRVHRLTQMSDLAKSGLYIALINIFAIFNMALIDGQLTIDYAITGAVIGAVNGMLSSVLMIGSLTLLESAFSITSMLRLLELSNPNHELLRKLLIEAPGTYHHSLMVGNLAEASAESIGANPLLVRVGAYYHDIGKVKRPEYFSENQRSFENPHEKIAPALSALIITSHVRDGVDIAREARLPQAIIDFIEQHHGTSLAKYFYTRALEEDREGNLSEESFRYEGPKPQSKEVALVMLADIVESGVRSLQDPTPARIRNRVRMLIKDKFDDGQLESCDLTFRDLDIIRDSFCKILEGIYHKRIEYPETIVREFEKRREKHGDHDYKPAEQSPIQ